jgi:hypothetical protein
MVQVVAFAASTLMPSLFSTSLASAHRYGHIDAQVAIVRKELGDGCVEDEAVTVHDGGADSLVYRAGGRLPGQAPPVPV